MLTMSMLKPFDNRILKHSVYFFYNNIQISVLNILYSLMKFYNNRRHCEHFLIKLMDNFYPITLCCYN